jgi:hypothetical protein
MLLSNDAAAKAGFYAGQGSANMSIADVYLLLEPMPEFIMKSDCNITQNQRHSFDTALLNAGKNMLIKITITPLPIITNLVFYSKN